MDTTRQQGLGKIATLPRPTKYPKPTVLMLCAQIAVSQMSGKVCDIHISYAIKNHIP